MPALPEAEKPALRYDKLTARNAQATWGGITGVLVGAAMLASFPPLAIPTLAASVSVAVLQRRVNAIEYLLEDPPRRDFTTATRPKSRRYTPGRLGDSALADATDAFALVGLRVVAYAEAAVRADERAQGASLAGDGASAHERRAEAQRWLGRARAESGRFAGAAYEHGVAWVGAVTDERILAAVEQGHVAFDAGARDAALRAAWRDTGLVVEAATAREIDRHVAYAPPMTSASDLAVPWKAMTELALASARLATSSTDRNLQWREVQRMSRLAPTEIGGPDVSSAELRGAAGGGDTWAMAELAAESLAAGDLAAAREWGAETRRALTRLPRAYRLRYYAQDADDGPRELPPRRQLRPPKE